MPRKNKKGNKQQQSRAEQAEELRWKGLRLVGSHPLFDEIVWQVAITPSNLCPQDGWAIIKPRKRQYGGSVSVIYVHETRLEEPAEWAYVLAHCLLHLAFGHETQKKYQEHEWNVACDCYIAKFLADLKLGTPPPELQGLLTVLQSAGFAVRSEEQLFHDFCERGIPPDLFPTGTAGRAPLDMICYTPEKDSWSSKGMLQKAFARSLEKAVSDAVDLAGGLPRSSYERYETRLTMGQRARNWFITKYPLLGALATSFKIIEDSLICQRLDIKVAAVNAALREIYINPRAGLSYEELLFVMAHEFLHVGLRHIQRCDGRDFYLWNVACDYVINDWLLEMGVGVMPEGLLYDPALKGESAEAIYDRIVTDLRRYRKLATLRGTGLGDMLGEPGWWNSKDGMDLDEFYRECLSQGYALHDQQGRGYLSAGLIEEIRALSQPPISWDVELAQWFDAYFTPLEKVRTYARQSRRQSATPDIPRPHWYLPTLPEEQRTFGVLLDTSGSMDRVLLAKALGAIASYSIARDVLAVRVVFCDAMTFDQGYMAPEEIAGNVKVRGRGGTILQPGIDLLERAENFPKDGPLLIITDGACDRLSIRRDHAFLMPVGHSLPFTPKGKVFWIR